MTEPVVQFNNVCFAYDQEEILHNITLTIRSGNMVAIVGPNGGGKSTLLRLMLGLITPIRGTVTLFSTPPEFARHRVAYVPQYLLFDPAFPITALDVVLLGRIGQHRIGAFRRADRAAAREALNQVSMAHLARRSFAGLSGGERQRIIIAQALIADPDLLLLDEPTANVDSRIEHQIYDLLNVLNQRMTIIVVSHNLSVVTRHASHVACVNRTASLLPLAELAETQRAAVHSGDMAVLQHELSCQIINPTESLRIPHHSGPVETNR
ncbi:ABC transporter ATP-binding protein [bacterium]|nr:ABC transporter ATP-binding protein [candidate division CSSED10-310 bacterium]